MHKVLDLLPFMAAKENRALLPPLPSSPPSSAPFSACLLGGGESVRKEHASQRATLLCGGLGLTQELWEED